jgi:hypothetical protein
MPEKSEIIRSITLSFLLGWLAVAALLRRRRLQHDSKDAVTSSSANQSTATDAAEGDFAEDRPPLLRDVEQSSNALEQPDTGQPPLHPQRSAEGARGAGPEGRRVEFLIHNISHKVCVHSACVLNHTNVLTL